MALIFIEGAKWRVLPLRGTIGLYNLYCIARYYHNRTINLIIGSVINDAANRFRDVWKQGIGEGRTIEMLKVIIDFSSITNAFVNI